jgi:hypothetical protein
MGDEVSADYLARRILTILVSMEPGTVYFKNFTTKLLESSLGNSELVIHFIMLVAI